MALEINFHRIEGGHIIHLVTKVTWSQMLRGHTKQPGHTSGNYRFIVNLVLLLRRDAVDSLGVASALPTSVYLLSLGFPVSGSASVVLPLPVQHMFRYTY